LNRISAVSWNLALFGATIASHSASATQKSREHAMRRFILLAALIGLLGLLVGCDQSSTSTGETGQKKADVHVDIHGKDTNRSVDVEVHKKP
jgi:hypothetical protein